MGDAAGASGVPPPVPRLPAAAEGAARGPAPGPAGAAGARKPGGGWVKGGGAPSAVPGCRPVGPRPCREPARRPNVAYRKPAPIFECVHLVADELTEV